jgi:hypothetical protein
MLNLVTMRILDKLIRHARTCFLQITRNDNVGPRTCIRRLFCKLILFKPFVSSNYYRRDHFANSSAKNFGEVSYQFYLSVWGGGGGSAPEPVQIGASLFFIGASRSSQALASTSHHTHFAPSEPWITANLT